MENTSSKFQIKKVNPTFLLPICSLFLFLSILKLPIGYYTFLRFFVSFISLVVIMKEYKLGLNYSNFIFGIISIIFNPIKPIYLNSKSLWTPIDISVGIIFLVKFIIEIKYYLKHKKFK